MNKELSCSFCEQGYYMDSEGICQACIYNLSKGCLMCEYSDPSKCMICASGFFMNKG